MKFNNVNTEVQTKALELLNNADDKSKAIVEVFEMLNAESHKELIEQLQIENEQLKADSQYAEKLGLRALSQNEKAFYEKLIAKQELTLTQGDVIPSETIDRTLEDVKAESDTLKLVNMAPAGVKKWLTGSHSGVASWTGLTDGLTAELSATITSFKIDVNKLHVLLIVPKAIRELALPLVDRYFTAILGEAIHDGLVSGYLDGNGKTAPVGIMRKLGEFETDGTNKVKTPITVTGFTPKELAPVKKALSNGGKRAVNKLYLIANPTDVYEYIEPSLYRFVNGAYMPVSKTEIEVIEEPMMTSGKAVFTIDGKYTMGMGSIDIKEYKETKAVEDADLLIAKVYANGRADDDNVAVVVDATQFAEFVPTVKTKTA